MAVNHSPTNPTGSAQGQASASTTNTNINTTIPALYLICPICPNDPTTTPTHSVATMFNCPSYRNNDIQAFEDALATLNTSNNTFVKGVLRSVIVEIEAKLALQQSSSSSSQSSTLILQQPRAGSSQQLNQQPPGGSSSQMQNQAAANNQQNLAGQQQQQPQHQQQQQQPAPTGSQPPASITNQQSIVNPITNQQPIVGQPQQQQQSSNPNPNQQPLPGSFGNNQTEQILVAILQQNSLLMSQLNINTSATTPVPTTTSKEHPKGNFVSSLFPNVPPTLVHKILLRKFTIHELSQLGRNPGDTVEQPRMQISSEGVIIPIEGTRAARDTITNFPFLLRCINTWWAIRCYRSFYDVGAAPAMDLLTGWHIFTNRLLHWYGTGGPNNYTFDGIRSYTFAILNQGIDLDDFDFGAIHLPLAMEHIFSKVNSQSRSSGSGSGSSASSGANQTCYNWNTGKPCNKTPCSYSHVCRTCGGQHKSQDHPPTPATKKP
jgi:hypothetical protein